MDGHIIGTNQITVLIYTIKWSMLVDTDEINDCAKAQHNQKVRIVQKVGLWRWLNIHKALCLLFSDIFILF